MLLRTAFVLLLAFTLSACDSAGGGDSISGTWVEANVDDSALYAETLTITEATFTSGDVYLPIECSRSTINTYGLTSSDETVTTYGEGSRARRVTREGDELVVTIGGSPTRYERTGIDLEDVESCGETMDPISTFWHSSDYSTIFDANNANIGATYATDYNASRDCYNVRERMIVTRVNGNSFTYRSESGSDTYSFDVTNSGQTVSAPNGATLAEDRFDSITRYASC